LHRLTVSLDTLRHDRFAALARFDELDRVKSGIAAAVSVFGELKIDSVVIRGVNDDELIDLVEFGRDHNAEVRFIEYMDVGGATQWSIDRVVSKAEILERLGQHYGPAVPLHEESSAPARRYRLPDGTVFGIIASTTAPFCADCDRSRLTADGMWYLCLYGAEGIDLRGALRSGATPEALGATVRASWERRRDRGAEERLASGARTTLIPLDRLRRDPHLEMHTRGG
jgi:cyclic pyranopterin phosphate synthase